MFAYHVPVTFQQPLPSSVYSWLSATLSRLTEYSVGSITDAVGGMFILMVWSIFMSDIPTLTLYPYSIQVLYPGVQFEVHYESGVAVYWPLLRALCTVPALTRHWPRIRTAWQTLHRLTAAVRVILISQNVMLLRYQHHTISVADNVLHSPFITQE